MDQYHNPLATGSPSVVLQSFTTEGCQPADPGLQSNTRQNKTKQNKREPRRALMMMITLMNGEALRQFRSLSLMHAGAWTPSCCFCFAYRQQSSAATRSMHVGVDCSSDFRLWETRNKGVNAGVGRPPRDLDSTTHLQSHTHAHSNASI